MRLNNLFSRRQPAPLQQIETVEGERSIPSVNRERSLQTRMTNLLAIAVVGGCGIVFLVWYTISQRNTLRDAETKQANALAKRASGDMKVPPLGFIPPPKPAPITPAVATATSAGGLLSAPPPPPPTTAAAAPTGPPSKTPAQLARDAMLKPDVMQLSKGGQSLQTSTVAMGDAAGGPMGDMLKPTITPAVTARLLPDRRFLLAKGTTIDCTLETAIDSTLPGMTKCVGAGKVFSADGSITLLEAGTVYTGETKGEAKQGQARVFVVWSEATTPAGVRINLDSPGADALGRSGLTGFVDTHFWDRFGAAIMLSVLDGSLALLAGTSGSGNTAVAINPTGSGNIAAEVLKSTVSIPPTIRINQGERIQIFTGRDASFKSVYDVRVQGE